MTVDTELLRRYAEANSEDAFAELVRRHLDLVYSAALRQVNGDRQLAQDVAQVVFSDLARKAPTLLRRPVLSGWLYTSTHFAAAKAVRTECRRRTHEREAKAMQELLQNPVPELDWGKLGPVLDVAMHELNDSDREMLLKRYFENRRLGEIAESLDLTEDAVRKRLDRALDRLRAFLLKRGIATAAALESVISANAIEMAPAGLAATLTTVSLAGVAAAGPGTGFGALKLMAITKFKFGFISAMVIAAVAIPLIIQRQGQIRLQRENQALMQQAARLQDENEGLSNQLVSANSAQLLSKEQLSELLRLRGEAGRLRQQLKQLDQARLENQRLRGQLGAAEPAPLTPPTSIPVPFQIRLVVDADDQNAETVTNRATIADTNAASETLYVQKTPLIDATAIQSADMVTDPSGNPQIDIVLTEQGRELFAKATRENLNKRLAIIMGGQSYLAPTVRDEITGGKIQLSGSFTEQQGRELAAKINEAISRR